MNAGWIVLLVCAGGYLALALYGKYRTIKQAFEDARDQQARANAQVDEPPAAGENT
jgi:cytochrome c-type biogenesis protein CcmH/NrfG